MCGTLAWASIDDLFTDLHAPQELYVLADTCISQTYFQDLKRGDAILNYPCQGLPQGDPESVLIYAAVVEPLIAKAERRLRLSGRPAGLRLEHEMTPDDAEQYNTRGPPLDERDSV